MYKQAPGMLLASGASVNNRLLLGVESVREFEGLAHAKGCL